MDKYSKELEEWGETNALIDSKSKDYIEHHNINGSISKAQDLAKEYSQLAIKYLFLLNGGAVLLMPAFVGVFAKTSESLIFLPGIFFVSGLVLVVLCTLFAYFSCVAVAQSFFSDRNYNLYTLRKIYYINISKSYKEKLDGLIEKEESLSEKCRKHSVCFEWIAIICGIISLICFILGAAWLSSIVGGM